MIEAKDEEGKIGGAAEVREKRMGSNRGLENGTEAQKGKREARNEDCKIGGAAEV